ncbi:aldose 1-epimerase family protein [Flavitalea flava]
MSLSMPISPGWNDKISNPAQLGGIETSVLDNGPGRGTRIAWINTGTGLRYKVVPDRAMDIADAFYNQHSLAWLNDPGITPPQPFSQRGLDWLKTFGGGLLTTCGLTYFGGPEADAYGERGLHGLVSNIPAEIESIIQPDPATGKMDMSITGSIKQTGLFGPSLALKRTISGTLGKASIRILDVVTNRGNSPAPHMLLYHCNFGWPLANEGSQILWPGSSFNCPAPLAAHSGTGEEVVTTDITADPSGTCNCGIYNASLGIALALRFQKKQLPWLINWRHFSKGEYVTGIEPATHPLIGQAKAREEGRLILLEPGESRSYELEIEVLYTQEGLDGFFKTIQV